jgi:putative ABC transport system permease protein
MIGDLRTLLLFYRRHLRVQPLRELMAVAGVAAGVALLFAVQVNSHSITGSFEEAVHGVAGRATLEIAARAPEGFDERVFEEIEHNPNLRSAAPIFEQQVMAVGPRGSRALTLVGGSEELGSLGGSLIVESQRVGETALRRGLLIVSEPVARSLGAKPGTTVTLHAGAHTERIALDATVPASKLGAIAESPVAAAPLPIVQVLAGERGRLTRILIAPREGRETALRDELTRRYGGSLNVRPVSSEARLLRSAAAPETQLTVLFSAISIVVGIVLAYNALLLASGERRRFIGYLIELGTPDQMIVASLAFDALILGLLGSAVGLLIGDAISSAAYRSLPGYLTAVFPIGSQRVIAWQTIAIAIGAGMLAAFAAAALPAIAVLRSSAAAEPYAVGRTLSLIRRPRSRDTIVFAAGAALVCIAVAASLLWPALAIGGIVLLVAGLVLCVPMIVRLLLEVGRRASRHVGDPSARLAVAELRGSPTRSVALFATGTIALFLMVLIGGSVADVQRAVSAGAEQTGLSADLWIRPSGAGNIYASQPFAPAEAERALSRLPAVRSALPFRSSFLDLPNRRVFVQSSPPQARGVIAPVQLVHGSLALAEARLREGGWAVVSQAIANEYHAQLGGPLTLPTPTGQARLRLAATIHNYGWPSGTVLMNADDYARLWATNRASLLGVLLAPGVSAVEGKRIAQAALGAGSGLSVQTRDERQSEIRTVLGSTLSRLSDTTTIVLIAAIFSVVAMMVAAVWGRRGRLDALISMGMSFSQLARLIFYEGGSMLLAGCVLGLAGGVVAQGLADNWAARVTDTQVHFVPAWGLGLRAIAIAIGISLAASTIAVLRTVGFQPRAAFSTQ